MEYYAGILFLTTNRVGDFDEAFTSRIHISLYYPQLDDKSTKAIFELNLDMIQRRFDQRKRKISIQRQDILDFAWSYFANRQDRKWNGRQIRNACQTALALAEFRAQGGSYERVEDADAVVELTVKDLETVAEAYLQFMHYLDTVFGADPERMAKSYLLRARETDVLKPGETEKPSGRGGQKGYDTRHQREQYLSTAESRTSYSSPSQNLHSLPPQRSATPGIYTHPPPPQQFHAGGNPPMMQQPMQPQQTMPGTMPGAFYPTPQYTQAYPTHAAAGTGYAQSMPPPNPEGPPPQAQSAQQPQQQGYGVLSWLVGR